MPIGLILNEFVLNTLKYAFSGGFGGTLSVTLKGADNSNYELVVKDTGVGLPEDLNFKQTQSLGLLIVKSLVSQIDGSLEVSNKNGAEFKIIFTDKSLMYSE